MNKKKHLQKVQGKTSTRISNQYLGSLWVTHKESTTFLSKSLRYISQNIMTGQCRRDIQPEANSPSDLLPKRKQVIKSLYPL